MLGEYIKNPGQRGLSLDNLALKYYNYEMISFSDVTEKKRIKFEDIELEKAAIYSGEDVYITHQLYKQQKESEYMQEMISTPSQRKQIKNILSYIELPLMKVLSKMEMTGIKIDRDILKGIGMRLEKEIETLIKEIYEIAGEEFNINSPRQVGEILFDKLGLPTGKKNKTGYSVSIEVLEGLQKEYPIAKKILLYRHYTKINSTYVVGLLEEASEEDRIHTSYNQTVTSTGRLSSTKPNLQNIPTGNTIAGEIRSAFIPDEDTDTLIAFDYSQIEVRLLAAMSEDANLLQAFRDGLDIHAVTGEFMFGKKNISGKERQYAKAVNFGVIYGISPFGLMKMIDISQHQAREYIDAFYTLYPGVRRFFDEVILQCKKNGYVETLFGRKRYIPTINDRNKMIASGAEREAINMPIQGTNADIIKIAMLRIQKMLDEGNYKSTMLLQVHDELVFNIKAEEREELIKTIPEIMQNIIPNLPIELKVDMAEGKNWKECK